MKWSKRRKVLTLTVTAMILIAVALLTYRVFFIKLVRVPTGAMANTIIPGDRLVVKKLFGEVSRGDVVMFSYPHELSVKYVGRLIGLPRESIEARDYFVYINGQPIPEQRVLVKREYDLDTGVLEEVSTQGSGPYRVFYYLRERTDGADSAVPAEQTIGMKQPYQIPGNNYFLMGTIVTTVTTVVSAGPCLAN